MTIDISVIVPFLNEERYVRRCVESLLASDYPRERCELIFVDNGSTDGGARIVGEYAEVTLLTETRGKVYTARNTAIGAAVGEVLAFTDADCTVGPRWLAAIHDAILVRGATFAMGPVRFASRRSELLDVIETYRNDHIQYVIEHQLWNHLYGYTNNLAVRADVFARLGLFAELPVPGDTELVHRCLRQLADTRIVYCPDMGIDHLELVSGRTLFRKLVDYGEFEVNLPQVRYAPPCARRRSGAEAYSARLHRYSLRRRLLFRLGVFACNACFVFGKWRGRLRRALGKRRSPRP
ncbi:MAG: glycosyltransferase [Planctomycetes bacterium]|nr:glycosyltransferase [Planctomycetota bacterium]